MVATVAEAADYLVDDQKDYEAIIPTLLPGDSVILRNGVWRHFEIVLRGHGTADNPITLTAETPGEVILSGRSSLGMAGDYLVVRGLVFRNGYSPTKNVIRFGINSDTHANNSRLTEVVIDRYNHPDRNRRDFWVTIQGQNNHIDHNYFAGKTTAGPTLVVDLRSLESRRNNHLIEENYFGHRPRSQDNGHESIRIGVSKFSSERSETTVHRNYFERCDGEAEIISNKSEGNIFTENVFDRSRGSLVLRLGGDNLVARNLFLGRGVPGTGGIRITDDHQVVVENYLEGLRGTGYLSALIIMNGGRRSGSHVTYEQVIGARIQNNTIVDVAGLSFGADRDGLDNEPLDSVFRENLIIGTKSSPKIDVIGDMSGIKFQKNVVDMPTQADLLQGEALRIDLVRADNGLLYPGEDGEPDAGVGMLRDFDPVDREETGPNWYPKPSPEDVNAIL